jgi:hypothetical protein
MRAIQSQAYPSDTAHLQISHQVEKGASSSYIFRFGTLVVYTLHLPLLFDASE